MINRLADSRLHCGLHNGGDLLLESVEPRREVAWLVLQELSRVKVLPYLLLRLHEHLARSWLCASDTSLGHHLRMRHSCHRVFMRPLARPWQIRLRAVQSHRDDIVYDEKLLLIVG